MDHISRLGFGFHDLTDYNPESTYHIFWLDDTDGMIDIPKYFDKTCSELYWNIRSLNSKEEVEGEIECLWCGGHYTYACVYKGGVDITNEFFDPGKNGNLPRSTDPLFEWDYIIEYYIDICEDKAKVTQFLENPTPENLHLICEKITRIKE